MAPPLYFFAGLPVAKLFAPDGRFDHAILAEYELDAILGDLERSNCSTCDQDAAPGPGGHSGGIVTYNPGGITARHVGYYPDHIEWTKVRSQPELWLGIDREAPPTAEELARPKQVSGHPVELADGQTYQIAVIRSPARTSELPQTMTFDAEGNYQGEIRREYLPLWERAGDVWDMFYKKPKAAMLMSAILANATAFLGVNYRVSRYEQLALQLIDTSNWEDVLSAAVDTPFMEEMADKEGPASNPPPAAEPSSTEPGEPASSPPTDPAAPNSP